ncbi:hypothetical protein [Flavilitoribacter nigricans]|uniref:Uncharacterized protein n=1 Tax=Flavilitoribacter nigricans (strain ATCC 23147 / DSM 23189 / NBRC 102662 / NCIMB 1420 / SS-2) TaxID=1122177 RepID=A0A2D0NEX5_FLAN2|nr:hypothetical protein [Flavilitoribacter nigricans]PHN06906.1 hypothetical protein CRP01_08805 [Flavilitoribacter nigricans DSM 23189 = NBRC 102662]
MSEINKQIIGTEFMKWVVIPYLLLISFGSFAEQGAPQGIPVAAGIQALEAHQGASYRLLASDLTSSHNILEYVEIELDENDNDHHYLDREVSQPPSPVLVPNKTTRAFFFPPKRKIKLFILYLSWKSFLHFL